MGQSPLASETVVAQEGTKEMAVMITLAPLSGWVDKFWSGAGTTPVDRSGFAEAAEAYHARVLEAHRRHARVDEPLPVPARWDRRPVNGQWVPIQRDPRANGAP